MSSLKTIEARVPDNIRTSMKIFRSREEERVLALIEQESSSETRRKFDENLKEPERRMLLGQINHLINTSRISRMVLLREESQSGLNVCPTTYIDTNSTLKALAKSSKLLPPDQLSDMVLIATKLAEKKKETKEAVELLADIAPQLSQESSKRLLCISLKFVESEWNLPSFLSSFKNLNSEMRRRYFEDLLSLSEEMVERGMNPKPAVSYFADLPASILRQHGEKIIELSEKLVKRGVDPKGVIWSISLLPPENVNELLLSEAAEKTMLLSHPFPRELDRKKVDKVVKLANTNVRRGWMSIEECWEMEKAMNSLLAYSPEKFGEVLPKAADLLKHNINPNDLFLLSKSLIQHNEKNFERNVGRVAELMKEMKESRWDVALSRLFYSSPEFAKSGFNNHLLYKLNQTLLESPERFGEMLDSVAGKIKKGEDPRDAFR